MFFDFFFGPSKEKWQMCSRKRRFTSEAEAKHALGRINPGKRYTNRPSRAYKCPYCSGYHLTTKPN